MERRVLLPTGSTDGDGAGGEGSEIDHRGEKGDESAKPEGLPKVHFPCLPFPQIYYAESLEQLLEICI